MNLQHKIFEIQQKMRQINWWWRIKLLMQEKQIQLYFWLLLSLSFIVVGFVAYQEIKNNIERVIENALKGLWRRSSKLIKRMKR